MEDERKLTGSNSDRWGLFLIGKFQDVLVLRGAVHIGQ